MVTKVLGYLSAPVRGFPKWRAYKAEDVRRVVTGMRVVMRDAANGGVNRSVFMAPENQALEMELGDLIHRVHDRKLRALCGQLLDNYKHAFAAAPPPMGSRVYALNGGPTGYEGEDARRAEAFARQKAHADAALESIEAVLRKLDKLEFFITSPG